MKLPKLKLHQKLEIEFHDIHSHSDGWKTHRESMDEPAYVCRAVGTYLGTTKGREVVIGTLSSVKSDDFGIRVYVPVGTITKIRKLK